MTSVLDQNIKERIVNIINIDCQVASNDVNYKSLATRCEYLEEELQKLSKKLKQMDEDIPRQITKEAARKTIILEDVPKSTKETSRKTFFSDIDKEKIDKVNIENILSAAGINLGELKEGINFFKQMHKLIPRDDEVLPLGPKDKLLRDENGQQFFEFNIQKMFKNSEVKNYDFGASEDELKILTAIEFLISENKILEAMKLIKWKKKIIRLAHLNGWDVAKIIAKNTMKNLGNK